MSPRGRFIAGARCPSCQAQDRVRWFHDRESGREWIVCQACGHEQERPQEAAQAAEAPAVVQLRPPRD